MESKEERRLKRVYNESSKEGPSAKKVKFSAVHEALATQFSPAPYTPYAVSQLIQRAFPNSESKPSGKSRQKYIFGVEESSTSAEDTTVLLEHERTLNSQLQARIQQLEARVIELEQAALPSATNDHLVQQMDELLTKGHQIVHGPNTPEHFKDFSLESVIDEIQTYAPDVYKLFMELGNTGRNPTSHEGGCGAETLKAITSISTLLKARSGRVKGMQLLISFMLLARATTRQTLTALNHAGVCMSYTVTWEYLKQLTVESKFLDCIREGKWMWVYDNINIHQAVRHEREDHHSSMLNLTARLAVKIQNLPDWEVDWSDSSPQCSRKSLTITDFLPDVDDAEQLRKRAHRYLMEFLVSEFSALSGLKQFLCDVLHPVQKAVAVPMKILFKDEKYKSETIDILTQLMLDAQLPGNPQVVVGDQLTCKNVRGCRLWRLPEVDPKDRLTWAHEVPGDFHFLWECLKVIFLMFWGNPAIVGSLCNLREYIWRLHVDKLAKVFNVGDEFLLHAFKGHLCVSICNQLKVTSITDPIEHENTLQWLEKTAEVLLKNTLMPTSSPDPVYSMHRSFMHTAYLYIDLRDAIRQEDGPHIIRHWKWWLPRFLGTGRKNYSQEALNLIANIKADFPKHRLHCSAQSNGQQ